MAFAALAAAIVTSPRAFVFDERLYIEYLELLHDPGPGWVFLESLTGATGPLYAFVHAAFEPLTGLDPVGMRLVNFALLLAVAGLLAMTLRRQGSGDALLASGAILILPVTWVLGGMALTSMPALVLLVLSLHLQLRGIEAIEQGERGFSWFVASGALLGAAVWGRQTAVILAVAPLIVALADRRVLMPALALAAVAAAMALPLAIAWGGPVPPEESIEPGFSPADGVGAFGYLAVCFALLTARLDWLLQKSALMLAIAIAVANGALGLLMVWPLASLADDYLSERAMTFYGFVCGSLLLWLGAAFAVWVITVTWQARGNLRTVAVNSGMLCASVTPMFIAHSFSSRYLDIALPCLILAAQPWRRPGGAATVAALAGCSLGLASLLSFYWNTMTSDQVRTHRQVSGASAVERTAPEAGFSP